MQTNAWFPPVEGRSPRARLFCFPAAGKGAAPYMAWRRTLPDTIEVLPARLPGREGRFREEPVSGFPTLVESLVECIGPLLDVPFAFFGHSLGALVAFELARSLRRKGFPAPALLAVASRPAPHLRFPAPIYHLPASQFLAAIQERYGALDPRFGSDSEFRKTFEPILRADFTLFDTYRYMEEDPLGCPIVTFGGETDFSSTKSDLRSWGLHTTGATSCTIFEGGHFFFEQDRSVLSRLLDDMTRGLAAAVPLR